MTNSIRTHRRAALGLATAVVFLSLGLGRAVAQNSPHTRGRRPGGELSRAARERQLGQAMFEQYLAASMPWKGERVNEFVNRLGQNLMRATDGSEICTFRVVYSLEPNAQAFPGGFVAVHSGVISLAETEAELASVISHEIAHINARHWQRQKNLLGLYSLLAMVPLMVGGGPIGWLAFYGAAAASPLAEAEFSRSFESEADALALQYLARSGYDPEAAVTVIEKYQALRVRHGKGKCGLLSSHPSGAKRANHLRKILVRMDKPDRVLETSSEYESVRAEILAYDRFYLQATGGGELGPPRLQRRPGSLPHWPE